MISLTNCKVRRKDVLFRLVNFPLLEQNCPDIISETRKLLKVNEIDFECEPLGK